MERPGIEWLWASRALESNPRLGAAIGAITGRDSFSDSGAAARRINCHAARLAEALAPEHAFATDEPWPREAMHAMWAESEKVRRHEPRAWDDLDPDTEPLFQNWIDALEHLHDN